jgi:hypothetical protein
MCPGVRAPTSFRQSYEHLNNYKYEASGRALAGLDFREAIQVGAQNVALAQR